MKKQSKLTLTSAPTGALFKRIAVDGAQFLPALGIAIALSLSPFATGIAEAAEAGDRIEERLDRKGDRIDARLDSRGDRIDARLDRQAARAETNGNQLRADRLDRKGDRIDARLDRRGDRIDRKLDRIGRRIDSKS